MFQISIENDQFRYIVAPIGCEPKLREGEEIETTAGLEDALNADVEVQPARSPAREQLIERLVEALGAMICHNCENRVGFDGKRQHENCPSCKPPRTILTAYATYKESK